MKKNLTTGMAALVLCGLFAGCSHDMDDYGGEKSVQKKHQMTYEQAFIARFGTPSPNLDWGFGSNTAATTRSLNSNSMAYSSKAVTRAATSTAESNWTLTEGYTATFNRSYYEKIEAKMPELQPTTGSDNFEFVSTGSFEFSLIFTKTTSNNEIGYYYYDPEKESLSERHEVTFLNSLNDQYNNGDYFKVVKLNNGVEEDYVPTFDESGFDMWNMSNIKEVKAKVFTINVPAGYHVGFWMKNHTSDWPVFYSNQAMNPSNYRYSAVVDLGDDTFLVGLEDWYREKGGDDDCNDVIFSVKKGVNPPPIIIPTEEYQEIRVMAEDLTVGQDTDFDFNDIVYDVRRYLKDVGDYHEEQVVVIVRAAGGTLPLYILDDDHEVHALFGADIDEMVNTNAQHRGMKGKDAEPYVFTLENPSQYGSTIGEIAKNIPVWVIKDGVKCVLTVPNASEGIASKIGVGTDYDWCDERQDIDNKYSLQEPGRKISLFSEWITGAFSENDWYHYAKSSIEAYKLAKGQ